MKLNLDTLGEYKTKLYQFMCCKKKLTVLIIIVYFISCNFVNAQANLCDGCYVWEFVNDKGERDETTRLLSNDIEDILSQYPDCKVLQRARYAKLQEQINNEKAIQSLNNATVQVKSELKIIQAKRVIFGTVSKDFQGNIILRLSFENLSTSQIKSSSAFISGEEYYSFDKRKQKLVAFINSFVNPDGKLPSPEGEISPAKAYLAQQTVDGIKITLNKFEQAGNNATFYFTLENMTPQNEVRNVHTHWDFNRLTDQEGNEYKCKAFKLGNQDSEIDLIFQTPVKCFVQFEVGAVKLTKAAKLLIGGYNYTFQFINLKL